MADEPQKRSCRRQPPDRTQPQTAAGVAVEAPRARPAAPSASSTRRKSTACWASTSATTQLQDKSRRPRHHQFGAGLLRAPADAGNRLRPPGAADDDLPAQLHLGQRGSQPGQHHLDPLRRLSELDSAAGDPGRVPRRGTGQLRPVHGRFQPDLFDRRRASGRPARLRGHAHRGPALHHHRAGARAAHGRGGAAGLCAGVRAAGAGQFQPRPPGDQSRVSRPSRGRPMPPSWSSCASTWKTAAGAPSCCCPTPRSSRSARCCCSSSWARSSAAIPSGKATLATEFGPPRSRSTPCSTNRSCRSTGLNLEVGQTVMLNATPEFQDRTALPRRAAVARPDGTRRILRCRARRGSHRTHRRPRARFKVHQGTLP